MKYHLDDTSNGVILRIVYVSIQSTDASSMRAPVEDVCDENGWPVEILCVNDRDVDEDPLLYFRLEQATAAADLVLVRSMSDPTRMKRFERFEKTLKECEGYVMVYSGNLEVAHTTIPTVRGYAPCSWMCFSSIWSAILRPISQLECQGIESGSME